jgi:glycerol uptake facilitator-like aquaporin
MPSYDLSRRLTAEALGTGFLVAGMPLSGAHFNPAVSFIMMLRGDLDRKTSAAYMAVQIIGGCLGTIALLTSRDAAADKAMPSA